MTYRCEIRITNCGESPAVLTARVDEIAGDLVRRNQKEFP